MTLLLGLLTVSAIIFALKLILHEHRIRDLEDRMQTMNDRMDRFYDAMYLGEQSDNNR